MPSESPKSCFSSCSGCTSSLHQVLELARFLHVHALLIPAPVEGFVKQPLCLHEVNLQGMTTPEMQVQTG